MAFLNEGLSLSAGHQFLITQLLDQQFLLDLGSNLLKGVGSLLIFLLMWWPFAVAPFVATWRVLEKARRPGWTSLVPIYNWIQLLRVAGLPAWWLVLLCVPIVNVVGWFVACFRMARAFGRERRFGLGLALLPPIYMVVLGFDDSCYRRLDSGRKNEAPVFLGVPEY